MSGAAGGVVRLVVAVLLAHGGRIGRAAAQQLFELQRWPPQSAGRLADVAMSGPVYGQSGNRVIGQSGNWMLRAFDWAAGPCSSCRLRQLPDSESVRLKVGERPLDAMQERRRRSRRRRRDRAAGWRSPRRRPRRAAAGRPGRSSRRRAAPARRQPAKSRLQRRQRDRVPAPRARARRPSRSSASSAEASPSFSQVGTPRARACGPARA